MLIAMAVVLVELFTSEGCSSCPPADDLLRQLRREPQLQGVEVVPLSLHVDYWNRLGWADPFSSASFTQRQAAYADRLRANPYTPQMIVDGQWQFVGSDRTALAQAVAKAATQPKGTLTIERTGTHLRIHLQDLPETKPADLIVAFVQDNLETSVTRGENGGRKLLHDAVVRQWKNLGRVAPGATLDIPAPPSPLRAVAFVQQPGPARILAVASE